MRHDTTALRELAARCGSAGTKTLSALRCLCRASAGQGVCSGRRSMMTHISPRILASIAQDISNGRPLWGMLRANEYLAPKHPLRLALAARAQRSLKKNKVQSEEVRQIVLLGLTLREISSRSALRERSPRPKQRRLPSHECLIRRAHWRERLHERNCRGTPSSSSFKRRSYAFRMRINSLELSASSPTLRSG